MAIDIPSFEAILDSIAEELRSDAIATGFASASAFEDRVREYASRHLPDVSIDFEPHPQAFPDIELGEFGIEVKFSTSDSWRSVANSILETNRIGTVKHVYVVFGKMGGTPDVRWSRYEECVMHVRTSHVPRFELEIGTETPLFHPQVLGIGYDDFRQLPMNKKMQFVRDYARKRLKSGERLWWLEDGMDNSHSLPIQARLYTKLPKSEKTRYRAEAVLLCPRIVESGTSRDKYDDAVLFLLTYHGVLCHQARDLFSAGSVANPNNDGEGGLYIERSLKLIEDDIVDAAFRMDNTLFQEYWGKTVKPEDRIDEWLKLADGYATQWKPSEVLFLKRPS